MSTRRQCWDNFGVTARREESLSAMTESAGKRSGATGPTSRARYHDAPPRVHDKPPALAPARLAIATRVAHRVDVYEVRHSRRRSRTIPAIEVVTSTHRLGNRRRAILARRRTGKGRRNGLAPCSLRSASRSRATTGRRYDHLPTLDFMALMLWSNWRSEPYTSAAGWTTRTVGSRAASSVRPRYAAAQRAPLPSGFTRLSGGQGRRGFLLRHRAHSDKHKERELASNKPLSKKLRPTTNTSSLSTSAMDGGIALPQ